MPCIAARDAGTLAGLVAACPGAAEVAAPYQVAALAPVDHLAVFASLGFSLVAVVGTA